MLFAALMVACRLLTQYLTSMAELLRLGLIWEIDESVHPVLVALLGQGSSSVGSALSSAQHPKMFVFVI